MAVIPNMRLSCQRNFFGHNKCLHNLVCKTCTQVFEHVWIDNHQLTLHLGDSTSTNYLLLTVQ